MFYWPCIVIDQCSITNERHFLYSVYHELTASICFEHYLLNFRRSCTNNNWYIACMLCLLAATTVGVEPSDNITEIVHEYPCTSMETDHILCDRWKETEKTGLLHLKSYMIDLILAIYHISTVNKIPWTSRNMDYHRSLLTYKENVWCAWCVLCKTKIKHFTYLKRKRFS
jgi:hypothetical protein